MRLPVTDAPPTPKRADLARRRTGQRQKYDHLKEVMEDDRFPYGQNAGAIGGPLNAIAGSLPLSSPILNGSICTNELRRSTLSWND
jgi:hypothetical protein